MSMICPQNELRKYNLVDRHEWKKISISYAYCTNRYENNLPQIGKTMNGENENKANIQAVKKNIIICYIKILVKLKVGNEIYTVIIRR